MASPITPIKQPARIRSAIEALQTLPFFGSTKVVWLKNANFLGDDQKARSADGAISSGRIVRAGRQRYSAPAVTLLISATEVDKRRSFYKTLLKRAELQVFDRLDSGAEPDGKKKQLEIVQQPRKKTKTRIR